MPELPKRIQRRRTKGWRMPEGAVYVGRPSRWGNRFALDRLYSMPSGWRRITAGEAVALFRIEAEYTNPAELATLRGKDLACWCPLCEEHRDGRPLGVECPNCQPCHTDVLLVLANV